MLTFDPVTRLLSGNGRISATWADVEQYLVQTAHRRDLYARLRAYNQELAGLVGRPFIQWLNGSFVSLKAHPGDIDLVSFVPLEAVESKLPALARFKNSAASPGDFPKLDCAVIPLTSEERQRNLPNPDKSWWEDHFRKTRPDRRSGLQVAKGFLELIVDAL